MKKFEVLDHPADLKIKSFGKTKEELFLNTLLGMMEYLHPEDINSDSKTKREMRIKSLDPTTLLVDFLNEVLYLTQVHKEIYQEIKFKKLSDAQLRGEVVGQKIKRFTKDIKAVTYYGAKIIQKEDGSWEAIILFDI